MLLRALWARKRVSTFFIPFSGRVAAGKPTKVLKNTTVFFSTFGHFRALKWPKVAILGPGYGRPLRGRPLFCNRAALEGGPVVKTGFLIKKPGFINPGFFNKTRVL